MNHVPLRLVGVLALGALLALLVLTPPTLTAQTSKGLPLEQLLRADGTLQPLPALSGAVDPTGWKLAVNPDGAPHFIRATAADTADIHWDDRFVGPSGVDGNVNAMAIIGSDLYIAGSFGGTDKIIANNIARWNTGTDTWGALGQGVDDVVQALAVVGTDLYVGGNFANAGGAPASHIAKWNGSAWSTLGTGPNQGVDDTVYAFAVNGTNLFVGGRFQYAGTTHVYGVARWDAVGSTWNALGNGVSSTVYALAILGSDLYAAGAFTAAGGNPANHIARWTGSAWVTLGTSPNDGADANVYALASAPPYLYVGGLFTHVEGTTAANYVARWNGSAWSLLGNGFTTGIVRSLLVSGPSVYAGGSFTATGITSVTRIARWDTAASTWSPLNEGLDASVNTMMFNGPDLYAGGAFSSYTNSTSPSPANHIARWSGGNWQALNPAPSNSVNGITVWAVAVLGPDLYIGGQFNTAGPIVANNIVKYNLTTNTWTTLGAGANNGVDGAVLCITVSGTDVYVGGTFTHAGGAAANNIAKWSGTSWTTLGTAPNDGTNAGVWAIAVAGSNVFVGGGFTTAGGASAVRVARWNGTTWSALGTGVNNTVAALAIIGSDLYVGGAFSTAGGTACGGVARWNGSTWFTLGTAPDVGTNGIVTSLATMGTSLYVGGLFTSVGGTTVPASLVAKWNGTTWSALGNGLTGTGLYTTWKLLVNQGSLYATGLFNASGILSANNIARWDTAAGGSWNALGSGLSALGLAVAVSGGDLFVGGNFTMAGSKPSYKLARWNPALVTSSVGPGGDVPRAFALRQNYPNPFNPTTTISYRLSAGSMVSLKVYDILGRLVGTLVNERQSPGEHLVRLDASRLASGVYIYKLTAGDRTAQQKMLLLK